jgi:hypothetical protein
VIPDFVIAVFEAGSLGSMAALDARLNIQIGRTVAIGRFSCKRRRAA